MTQSKQLRYKFLLIDHDDTSVDSTPHIHYPAHRKQMESIGRDAETLSLTDWFGVNFEPGLKSYWYDILKLSDDELDSFYKIWRGITTQKTPDFFPGLLDLLYHFSQSGGKVVVVSHSEPDIILENYLAKSTKFQPDHIIGFTGDHSKNKPHPWPIEECERRFGARREEMLVVDDLKPGLIMARNAGVDSAAVGWSHGHPKLHKYAEEHCTFFLESIKELEFALFI
jgi:beta-phosphoglucomutase-like phosphatase (HAD superfamily)